MKFKSIEFKNILSYGSNPTRYEFKNGLTLFKGPIGAGKSTIIDAIHFALFGKPFRKIQIPKLVNAVNKKDFEVVLEFEKNGSVYKVKRTKTDFLIFKDGELIPVSHQKREYQQLLNSITGLNENLFSQVVVKSITAGGSFFALPIGAKREVIETLFGIKVFSFVRQKAVSEISKLENELRLKEVELEKYKELMKNEIENKKKFELLVSKKQTEIEKEINQIKKSIEKINQQLEKESKVKENFSKVRQAIQKLHSKKSQIEAKLKTSKTFEYFFENCSECKIFKNARKCYKLEDIEVLESQLQKVNEKIEVYRKKEDKLMKTISKINSLKEKRKYYQKRLSELTNRIVEEDIQVNDEKIQMFKEKIRELKEEIKELKWKIQNLKELEFLCSDKGLKNVIIRTYLPLLNKEIMKYLEKFNADFIILIDSDLSERVISREDFKYFSFSEGEKRIIDLSIIFAFIEFTRIKNKLSDMNLLILDEITTGLDREVDELLHSILKELAANKEIILMSHTVFDESRYDRIVHVEKIKGFSYLKFV